MKLRRKRPLVHDHGELWDRSDIRALKKMANLGFTYERMAQRLGRTVAAVRSKLYRLKNS